jgi:sulfur-oxidizing protein SoxX
VIGRTSKTALAASVVGVAMLAAAAPAASGQAQRRLADYAVVGDAIPAPLRGARGDPARGRAIVVNRQSTCLLCHSGPFPEERFQGNLAPDLKGVGSRWSEGQLRLRMVDSTRLNPHTIMPPFYRVEGLARVGRSWDGLPILSAAQVEDVVAYLATLKN